MEQDLGKRLTSLKVDGGASKNNFLMQFQSGIINTDVLRPKCVETTAMGAAYLAGLTVGFWDSREDIIQNWTIGREFQPNMEESERKEKLSGWAQAVAATRGWSR